MEGSLATGIGLAIIASSALNIGKGVQKWKVRVLGHGRKMFSREHRREFLIWLTGVLLTASASIFYSLALQATDKSSMVSALNGVGLIGLTIFAALVLKERIGPRELGGTGLIIAGTAVMGLFNAPVEGGQVFDLSSFLIVVLSMVAVLVPLAFYAWRARKAHGLIFGALAGTLVGTSMVLGDMALVEAGNDFVGQLSNPYPYVAITVGTGALALTQVAFWRSTAMVVVPVVNSAIILSPVVIESFTFGTTLMPMQYVGLAVIVGGAVLLTMGGSTEGAAETPADEAPAA